MIRIPAGSGPKIFFFFFVCFFFFFFFLFSLVLYSAICSHSPMNLRTNPSVMVVGVCPYITRQHLLTVELCYHDASKWFINFKPEIVFIFIQINSMSYFDRLTNRYYSRVIHFFFFFFL